MSLKTLKKVPDIIQNDDKNQLRNIDLFVRDELVKNKLPSMPHSTGHGVGLEIHEPPSVSSMSKDSLQPGHVFTVEPGVYYPHQYGLRIEDTVMIDQNYKPVILTKFSKTLTIIRD